MEPYFVEKIFHRNHSYGKNILFYFRFGAKRNKYVFLKKKFNTFPIKCCSVDKYAPKEVSFNRNAVLIKYVSNKLYFPTLYAPSARFHQIIVNFFSCNEF